MLSHILIIDHVCASAPCSAYALAQARPTMSYIPPRSYLSTRLCVGTDMWLVVGNAHLAKEIPKESNLVKTFHENKCLTSVSQRRMAKVDLCKSKSHGIQ